MLSEIDTADKNEQKILEAIHFYVGLATDQS